MNRIIYIITFFLYSGYYALLALVISFGLTNNSRFVTVPLRLGTTILMIYSCVNFLKNERYKLKSKIVLLSFMLFWFLYFIKVLISEGKGDSLIRNYYEYIFYALNFCILPFLVFLSIDFNKYKNIILSSFIFSGFLMGLVSFFLYKDILISGGVGRISMARYAGFEQETLSPLALSYAGSLTLALCIFELLYNKNRSKIYSIYLSITIVFSLIMFFLGASRGSVVAMFFCLPILFYYGSIKNRLRFILFALVISPVIIWGAIKSGSSVFSRVAQTVSGEGTADRGDLWKYSWIEFVENPFFGGRIEIGFYPHNFILETLMSTGILGFILLVFIFIVAFKRVNKLAMKNDDYIWVFIVFIQGFCQHFVTGALYTSVLLFAGLGLTLSNFQENFKK